MNSADIAASFRLLSEVAASRQADLNQYDDGGVPTESDSEADLDAPVMEKFFAEGGSEAIHQMTNFTSREFELLYNHVQQHAESAWNGGRGKKSAFTAKDIFFMLFTTVKHGGKWDFLGAMFRINGPKFERTIMRTVEIVHNVLYAHVVKAADSRFTVDRLQKEGKMFDHHRSARYATGVTFQMANRPSGNHDEAKPYFSKKHGLYGYKVEMSVLPNGLTVMATQHYPGSVHDLDTFRRNLTYHQNALKKSEHEKDKYNDIEAHIDAYPNHWSVLVDKGYQGALELVRAIITKRKPPRGILSIDEQHKNNRIAHDRLIVENYFGRLGTLWALISAKYRWSERNYDIFVRICVALTNFHIQMYPLRYEDGENHHRYLRRMNAIGNDISRKRKRQQSEYRARRRAAMARRFPESHDYDETQSPGW